MGKQVEKKVEDAHEHTQQLATQQGPKVTQAVPSRMENPSQKDSKPKEETKVLGKKVDDAVDSLNSLGGFGNVVKKDIGANDPIIRVEGEKGEERFKLAAEGHDKPERIFTSKAEARESHVDPFSALKKKQGETAKSEEPRKQLLEIFKDNKKLFGKDITKKQFDEIMEIAELDALGRTATQLISGELDPRTAERFNNTTAVVVQVEKGDSLMDRITGDAIAFYTATTNKIIVYEQNVEGLSTDYKLLVLVHEQFHYAAYLGGAANGMRWRDENEEPCFINQSNASWLHEGLTELHAQQLVRENGYDPGKVHYRVETATAFLLQKLVGEDVLKQAYITGDFSEVRKIMNEKLGEGAFETIMRAKIPGEPLLLLIGMMHKSGIDTKQWGNDPIIKGTGMVF